MGDRAFIGFVLGGPPMQLLKPVRAMVLFRILRRRSSAACGVAGGCSLARMLFVFLCFPEGLSAKCVDACASRSFDRVRASVRCNAYL
jgi:hypothetical protein